MQVKRWCAWVLSLALLGGLSSCTNADPFAYSQDPAVLATSAPEDLARLKPRLDPATLNWGMRPDPARPSDIWIPINKVGVEPIFFTPSQREGALCTVHWLNPRGEVDARQIECKVDSKHLRNLDPQSAPALDFIFLDGFTTYETESGVIYSRGNYEELKSQLAGFSFMSQVNPRDIVTLNPDKTFFHTSDAGDSEGSWTFATPTALQIQVKGQEGPHQLERILFDEEGRIMGLRTSQNVDYYPIPEERE